MQSQARVSDRQIQPEGSDVKPPSCFSLPCAPSKGGNAFCQRWFLNNRSPNLTPPHTSPRPHPTLFTCCVNPTGWLVVLSFGYSSFKMGSQFHMGLFWEQFHRVNVSYIHYLCKVLSGSSNSPSMLSEGQLFPHWPFARHGNTPGNPVSFFLRLIGSRL